MDVVNTLRSVNLSKKYIALLFLRKAAHKLAFPSITEEITHCGIGSACDFVIDRNLFSAGI